MNPTDRSKPVYVAGLDLGQASDYTGLAVFEGKFPQAGGPPEYAVRHLERFELHTSYTAIVERMQELFDGPPLAGGFLAADATGVGRAVIDMLAAAELDCRLVPITITGGHQTTRDPEGYFHVPKKELVATLQVLLQSRRLVIAPALALAQTLARELQFFRVKITAAANETFEAWRERDHDDLVLAVALAAWLAERVFVELAQVEEEPGAYTVIKV
jgi:hypothetical protein